MVKKIDVEKVFETIKEFDPEKFVDAQHHQRDEWPLLVHPYDNPKIVSADEAKEWLRDDDYIMGVVIEDKARAYPLNIANYYHQINDVLAGEPILVND